MNRLTLPILAASLALSGCVLGNIHNNSKTAGIDSVQKARAAVRPGMSMAQVKEIWGSPSLTSSSNGRTVWSYVHQSTSYDAKDILNASIGGVVIGDERRIEVRFNTKGRVARVDYSSQTN